VSMNFCQWFHSNLPCADEDASCNCHVSAQAECSNEMLDMLLEMGADINSVDSTGRTPLLSAVTRKSLSMAAALLVHSSPTFRAV
jgi:ankyrin repeat protein